MVHLPVDSLESYVLLVVDMQYDGIAPSGQIYSPEARKIIPNITELTQLARDSGMRVVHSQHAHRSDYADFGISEYFEPLSCVEGTPGQDFYPGMEPSEEDVVVRKRRYSVFEGTHLDLLLRQWDVKGIFVCGIQTEACVLSTVVEARNKDYKVWMVRDALTGLSEEIHETALQVCGLYFADVIDMATAHRHLGSYQRDRAMRG